MVTFQVWYYPFSFDEEDAVKCQVKVYKEGACIEVLEFKEILDEKKLNKIKQRIIEQHEVCTRDR